MRESFIQKTREAAAELGDFTISELVVFLKMKNKPKIRKAIDYLLRVKGEVVSIRPRFYRYQGNQKPLNKVDKMWRAMRIKEYFSRQDILKLSGASYVYVKTYFAWLKREGFITHISGRGYKDALFRLTDPETAPLDRPITSKGRLVSFQGERKH